MDDIDPETFQQAIREHAKYLGMNLEEDEALLWLAEEALTAEVPPGWETGSTDQGLMYYFNPTTHESMWEHPLDSEYRARYQQLKAEAAQRRFMTPEQVAKLPSKGSLPKPLLKHDGTPKSQMASAMTFEGDDAPIKPEGTTLRTVAYGSPSETLSSINNLLSMGGYGNNHGVPSDRTPPPGSPSRSPGEAVARVRHSISGTPSPSLPHVNRGAGASPAAVTATVASNSAPLTPAQVKAALPFDDVGPSVSNRPSPKEILEEDDDWDDDDEEGSAFQRVMTGSHAKPQVASTAKLSPESPVGPAGLPTPLRSPATPDQMVSSPTPLTGPVTASPPQSAKLIRMGSMKSVVDTARSKSADTAKTLQRTHTAGRLKSHAPAEDLSTQRKIDHAVAQAKAEAEIEIQKIKRQYANSGTKTAVELGKAQTERDELAMKVEKLNAEISVLTNRLALMERTCTDSTDKAQQLVMERDRLQSELAKATAALNSATGDSSALIEQLEQQLEDANRQLSLERESAAADADRNGAATRALTADLEAIRAERNALQSSVRDLETKLHDAVAQADSQGSIASEVSASLTNAQNAALQAKRDAETVRSEKNALDARVSELTHELTKMESDAQSAHTRLEEATKQYDELRDLLNSTRQVADEAAADFDRQVRALRDELDQAKVAFEVQTASLEEQHHKEIQAMKQEHKKQVSALETRLIEQKAEMIEEESGRAAKMQASHLQEIHNFHSRIAELEENRRLYETDQSHLIAQVRKEEADNAANKLVETQAQWQDKLKALRETSDQEISRLQKDRLDAVQRAAEFEASWKSAVAELEFQVASKDKTIEEMSKHLENLKEVARKQADDLEAQMRLAHSQDMKEAEDHINQLQTSLNDAIEKHREEMRKQRESYNRALEDLRAVKDERDAHALTISAKEQAISDLQAQVQRLADTVRATQVDNHQLQAKAAGADCDPRIIEMEAQAAKQTVSISKYQEEIGRLQRALQAARDTAIAEAEQLRDTHADLLERERVAALSYAQQTVTAELQTKFTVEKSALIIEKEELSRRVAVLQGEVDFLSSTAEQRLRDNEIRAVASIEALRSEMDRLIQSNQALVGLLTTAQQQNAQLNTQLHVLEAKTSERQLAETAVAQLSQQLAQASAKVAQANEQSSRAQSLPPRARRKGPKLANDETLAVRSSESEGETSKAILKDIHSHLQTLVKRVPESAVPRSERRDANVPSDFASSMDAPYRQPRHSSGAFLSTNDQDDRGPAAEASGVARQLELSASTASILHELGLNKQSSTDSTKLTDSSALPYSDTLLKDATYRAQSSALHTPQLGAHTRAYPQMFGSLGATSMMDAKPAQTPYEQQYRQPSETRTSFKPPLPAAPPALSGTSVAWGTPRSSIWYQTGYWRTKYGTPATPSR